MTINKKIVIASALTLLLTTPMMAFALSTGTVPQGNGSLNIDDLITAILSFIWPVFIGFAVIMFILAGFFFISAQGDADGVGKARQFLIWGVVGVAVGVLAFSIPFVVKNLLGANGVN